jgi:nucleotide-binding universal stress UspA family protein
MKHDYAQQPRFAAHALAWFGHFLPSPAPEIVLPATGLSDRLAGRALSHVTPHRIGRKNTARNNFVMPLMKPKTKVKARRPSSPRPLVEEPARPTTILVPTDFSYAADRALHHAVQLARRFRARVALLHVVAPAGFPEILIPALRVDLPQLVTLSRERLDRLVRRFRIRPSHLAVKAGHAAGEILQFADEIGADLIVIGARGHGALKRAMLGSAAERVVRLARCPVMVVPLPAASKQKR